MNLYLKSPINDSKILRLSLNDFLSKVVKLTIGQISYFKERFCVIMELITIICYLGGYFTLLSLKVSIYFCVKIMFKFYDLILLIIFAIITITMIRGGSDGDGTGIFEARVGVSGDLSTLLRKPSWDILP